MNKLLIFHQGALGDLVTLFPVLIQLRSQYQAIDLICKDQIGRLARYLNLAGNVYPAESAVFSYLFGEGAVPRQLNLLSHYSTILLFSRSVEFHQRVASLTAARVHLVPPRPEPDHRRHITDHYVTHLQQLSVLPQGPDDSEVQAIRRDRRPSGFDTRRVLIHPGSGSRRKNWPIDHFVQLGQLLSRQGFETMYLLGPADEHLAGARLAPVERPPDLVALAGTLKTAGGFVGNDSGVSHLAAFLGLPTTVVFGPSDPLRWAPRGRATAVIRSTEQCTPCFETEPASCESMDCLERITPATVMASFLNCHRFCE